MRSIEQMFSGLALMSQTIWVFSTALVFLAGGLLLVLILFGSRIIKSHYHQRSAALRARYQKILNKIVVNETFQEKGMPNTAFEFYMAELRNITSHSRFARQILITQILDVKKNLTGNSSQALIRTYYALLLNNESLKKLKSAAWQKKALAIRELAEMGHYKCIPIISKFLYRGNQTLREESLMALVRLEERPLSFLDHYKGDLSRWMQLNIYNYLSKLDTRKLPQFSQWFEHENLNVRLFSISMTRQFKQTASLPGLADLLYGADPRIVGLSVSALGELEAYQYREEIIKLAAHVWNFAELARRAVECLGRIADPERDINFLGKFLSHPDYTVRLEAVSAIRKLGVYGEEFLRSFNEKNDQRIEGLLNHFSEPLLS